MHSFHFISFILSHKYICSGVSFKIKYAQVELYGNLLLIFNKNIKPVFVLSFRIGEACTKREIIAPFSKHNRNITLFDYIHVFSSPMEKVSTLQR